MAVGMTTGLLLAGGGLSAGSSILGGEMQAKSIQNKASFDAAVYDQQAEMVMQKKKITNYQYNRAAGRHMGDIVLKTAGKGLMLSGSPLAVLIDSETQLKYDQAIENYNLDIERNYALSGAAQTRAKGDSDARSARFSGYSNAFSTILNTGAQVSEFSQNTKNTIYRPSYFKTGGGRTYNSPYGNIYKY